MSWLCGLYYPTSCYWHLRKNNLESRCGAFNVSAFGCRGFLSSNLDVARIWIRNLDVFFQPWNLQIMDLCGSTASISVEKFKRNFCENYKSHPNLCDILQWKLYKVIQIYATFYNENYAKLSKFMRHSTTCCMQKYIRNVICSMITNLWWRLLEKTP